MLHTPGSGHDGQATDLCRKGINLIGLLPHMAEKALNRMGTAHRTVHDRRASRKREEMLFIFAQAPAGFWIPLLVYGFACAQIEECMLFFLLLPNASRCSRDLLPLPLRKSIEHVALLVDQAPLP